MLVKLHLITLLVVVALGEDECVAELCLQQTVVASCPVSGVHSHHPKEKKVLQGLSTAEERKEMPKDPTHM